MSFLVSFIPSKSPANQSISFDSKDLTSIRLWAEDRAILLNNAEALSPRWSSLPVHVRSRRVNAILAIYCDLEHVTSHFEMLALLGHSLGWYARPALLPRLVETFDGWVLEGPDGQFHMFGLLTSDVRTAVYAALWVLESDVPSAGAP